VLNIEVIRPARTVSSWPAKELLDVVFEVS